ncbi:MAG TPA: OsmC family protein [Accumulibacter sp.]|nr:OsmC family protein [Accumulibacter sp.]
MPATSQITDNPVTVSENGRGPYQQTVRVGKHQLIADEPPSLGGDDGGPAPTDFLLAALGACTSITLRMYAERKQIPLAGVQVALTLEKIEQAGKGKVDHITRKITLTGDLSSVQRDSLLSIANKCPVHRLLHSGVLIDSELVETGDQPTVG